MSITCGLETGAAEGEDNVELGDGTGDGTDVVTGVGDAVPVGKTKPVQFSRLRHSITSLHSEQLVSATPLWGDLLGSFVSLLPPA